ncbi:ethanolamine utilization protein EutC [Grimontia sp. NTOU-MAR1]|uniref:ethanolamine utilization protein EutC n=1 Tax=Grimontia sp. NTOU-MAR1 TaxID=3111011 RepID=UPI002DB809B5|nr:ethanolamine utilization protein EutC [Grimontia sp. NTOU-MAR1]WRW00249.1 ethanolamine utilization protein EutC [Grimontia sp. NTOU-MAR1]
MVVLNEQEIRDAVVLTSAVVYEMGAAFQSGEASFSCQPRVQQMMLEPLNGLLCVKSFYSADQTYFVVKMAGNYRLDGGGVSQTHGMNALYHSKSGQLHAVLADNGYLTQIRTAAAGGYAVDLLAPENIDVAVIVGTGRQARMQLSALLLVRRPSEIRCFGRSAAGLKGFADWANETHHIDIQCYGDESAALAEADLVITATTSRTPVLHRKVVLGEGKQRDRLIIAMGSDSKEKRELEEALVLESDRWICDDISQSLTLGELKGISEQEIDEVIKPISLEKVGRGAVKGLTICDLTGVAKLDLAISEYCLARVSESALA